MSINFQKSGNIINASFDDPEAHNLLYDSLKQYTQSNPYILTGTGTDIIQVITNKITLPTNLGNTFYLMAKVNPAWSPSYGHSTSSDGKATIWYYLSKTTGTIANSYDSPVCYHSNNWIAPGVWKTIIDVSTYKEFSIRINTYSDGTKPVTCKFWDFKMIPAPYFAKGFISDQSAINIKPSSIVSPSINEY